jgi:hypothetical protein
MDTTAAINEEIAAYDRIREDLEARLMGKWVLIHDGEFISHYESFELAAADAVPRFGRGPYLIRQVGAPPVTLPASVIYHPDYAPSRLRLR